MPAPAAPDPVLLFDGECGLCRRVVHLLLRLDRRGQLRFTPLQGAPAQEFLRIHGLPTEDFSTLVFVPDWAQRNRTDFQVRTDGVIGALRAIGGAGPAVARGLAFVPRSWRDAGYRLVARGRTRLFGPWRDGPGRRPEWAARIF
jgi:predicted DCC family thiol-disulfide oxidoreductase YuxK